MVLNNNKIKYVLAAIAAIDAKAGEGALQTAVGVKVDANGRGVGKVGGPVFRHLGSGEAKSLEEAAAKAKKNLELAEAAKRLATSDYLLTVKSLDVFEAFLADTEGSKEQKEANEAYTRTYNAWVLADKEVGAAKEALAEF